MWANKEALKITSGVIFIIRHDIITPLLCKQFKYNLLNDFIVISKDTLYITYPNSNEIFGCQLSTVYYCEVNTLFYLLDSTNHCSNYLLQNNLNKIEQFCSLSVTNKTTDQAISLDYHYWVITTMVPTKLQVVCLTSCYYIKLKCPVDIIFLLNAYASVATYFFVYILLFLNEALRVPNYVVSLLT